MLAFGLGPVILLTKGRILAPTLWKSAGGWLVGMLVQKDAEVGCGMRQVKCGAKMRRVRCLGRLFWQGNQVASAAKAAHSFVLLCLAWHWRP